MHKNHIWLAFLATVILVVLWFSVATGYKIYQFISYSAQAPITSINLTIVKRSEDRYLLKTNYAYSVNNQTFEGEDTLEQPIFRNSWAAKEAIPETSNQLKNAWYSPKHPSQSIIKKVFPIKETIYSGILWILLIYFVWLGYYVNRRRNKWS